MEMEQAESSGRNSDSKGKGIGALPSMIPTPHERACSHTHPCPLLSGTGTQVLGHLRTEIHFLHSLVYSRTEAQITSSALRVPLLGPVGAQGGCSESGNCKKAIGKL